MIPDDAKLVAEVLSKKYNAMYESFYSPQACAGQKEQTQQYELGLFMDDLWRYELDPNTQAALTDLLAILTKG